MPHNKPSQKQRRKRREQAEKLAAQHDAASTPIQTQLAGTNPEQNRHPRNLTPVVQSTALAAQREAQNSENKFNVTQSARQSTGRPSDRSQSGAGASQNEPAIQQRQNDRKPTQRSPIEPSNDRGGRDDARSRGSASQTVQLTGSNSIPTAPRAMRNAATSPQQTRGQQPRDKTTATAGPIGAQTQVQQRGVQQQRLDIEHSKSRDHRDRTAQRGIDRRQTPVSPRQLPSGPPQDPDFYRDTALDLREPRPTPSRKSIPSAATSERVRGNMQSTSNSNTRNLQPRVETKARSTESQNNQPKDFTANDQPAGAVSSATQRSDVQRRQDIAPEPSNQAGQRPQVQKTRNDAPRIVITQHTMSPAARLFEPRTTSAGPSSAGPRKDLLWRPSMEISRSNNSAQASSSTVRVANTIAQRPEHERQTLKSRRSQPVPTEPQSTRIKSDVKVANGTNNAQGPRESRSGIPSDMQKSSIASRASPQSPSLPPPNGVQSPLGVDYLEPSMSEYEDVMAHMAAREQRVSISSSQHRHQSRQRSEDVEQSDVPSYKPPQLRTARDGPEHSSSRTERVPSDRKDIVDRCSTRHRSDSVTDCTMPKYAPLRSQSSPAPNRARVSSAQKQTPSESTVSSDADDEDDLSDVVPEVLSDSALEVIGSAVLQATGNDIDDNKAIVRYSDLAALAPALRTALSQMLSAQTLQTRARTELLPHDSDNKARDSSTRRSDKEGLSCDADSSVLNEHKLSKLLTEETNMHQSSARVKDDRIIALQHRCQELQAERDGARMQARTATDRAQLQGPEAALASASARIESLHQSLSEANDKHIDLHDTIETLSSRLATSNGARDEMRQKFDNIQRSMTAALDRLVAERSEWIARGHEAQQREREAVARQEAEMHIRILLDREVERLQIIVSESQISKHTQGRLFKQNEALGQTVIDLRRELLSTQDALLTSSHATARAPSIHVNKRGRGLSPRVEGALDALAQRTLSQDAVSQGHDRSPSRSSIGTHNDTIKHRCNELERLSQDQTGTIADLRVHLKVAKDAAAAAVAAARYSEADLQPVDVLDVREKISPQALRQSLIALQEQLQDRERELDGLRHLVSTDAHLRSRLAERDVELAWLRDLKSLNVDEVTGLIDMLAGPDYNIESVKAVAVRVKANLEMEQSVNEGRGARRASKTSQALAGLTNFASPRASRLVSALGNWKRERSMSVADATLPAAETAVDAFAATLPVQNHAADTGSAPRSLSGGRINGTRSASLEKGHVASKVHGIEAVNGPTRPIGRDNSVSQTAI